MATSGSLLDKKNAKAGNGHTRPVDPAPRETREEQTPLRRNNGSLFGSSVFGISTGSGTGVLSQFIDTSNKVITAKGWPADRIQVLPLDPMAFPDKGLKIAAAIITMQVDTVDGSLNNRIAYQIVLLGATNTANPVRVVRDASGREMRVTLTLDAGDDKFINDAAADIISAKFPGKETLQITTSTFTEPASVASAHDVQCILEAGLVGCQTKLEESLGIDATVGALADMVLDGYTVTIDANSTTIKDASQQPIHVDFLIMLTKRGSSTNQTIEEQMNSLHGGTGDMNIMRIGVRIDMAWKGDNGEPAFDNFGRRNPNTQQYVAKIILVHVDCYNKGSIPMMLVAAHIQRALMVNKTYRMAFGQTVSVNDPLNNIGILTMETPVMLAPGDQVFEITRFPSNEDGTRQYNAFMDYMIVPEPQICVDAPIIGPDAWKFNAFLQLAKGGKEAAVAEQYISDVLDKMTGNRFSGKMPVDVPFAQIDTVLERGSWPDPDGVSRDLGEMTYVRAANAILGKGNLDNAGLLTKLSNTFNDSVEQLGTHEILSRRHEAMVDIIGNYTVLGTTVRCELAPELMSAINAAFNESEFKPMLEGVLAAFQSQARHRFSGRTVSSSGAQAFRAGYGGRESRQETPTYGGLGRARSVL